MAYLLSAITDELIQYDIESLTEREYYSCADYDLILILNLEWGDFFVREYISKEYINYMEDCKYYKIPSSISLQHIMKIIWKIINNDNLNKMIIQSEKTNEVISIRYEYNNNRIALITIEIANENNLTKSILANNFICSSNEKHLIQFEQISNVKIENQLENFDKNIIFYRL